TRVRRNGRLAELQMPETKKITSTNNEHKII
ncbi:MAG: hypothetical protein JWQ96_2987, partial [Segetibacter sp.]|nr:hypothetical protein [Segetibacter sp.]